MRKSRVAAAITGLLPIILQAQDADMEIWLNAKVVKYHVEGVHQGRVQVVLGDYNGMAEVTDRITADFTWDFRESDAAQLLGELKLSDGKTEVADLRSDGTDCPPPNLDGTYEHFQSTKTEVAADLIVISGTRSYPSASVSNYPASCSMRQIPGGDEEETIFLSVMDPEVIAMASMPGMADLPGLPFKVSADRKSFSVGEAPGWIWTYTPTVME